MRHNIIIYMNWDIPLNKGYDENSPWEAAKNVLKFGFMTGGLFIAHIWYPETLPPPSHSDLNILNGHLKKIIRNTGRGGAIKAVVIDNEGRRWLFPNNTNYLHKISAVQATRLNESCAGKPIVVLWAEEPKMFFGSNIDAWEMTTCEPSIKINYNDKVKIRNKYRKQSKKVVNFGLIMSLILLLSNLQHYRKAKELLDKKIIN